MAKLPSHVGVDFGNHSVKAVHLDDIESSSPTLVNFGSQPTPQGVINSPDAEHMKQLIKALKQLYTASNIKNDKVVLAIPESSVFTRFLELPGIKDEEIQSAVYYEAKQYIPLPIEEVQLSFLKIGENKEKNAPRILLVAAPIKIVKLYQEIADGAGLDLIAIETESVALGRATFRALKDRHIVMLDFGADTTDMSVMSDGSLVFSQSISIGSDALTQSIINQFNFEYVQAEEYKRNYGLVPDVLEGRVAASMQPVMDSIITEVRRGIEFYKSKTLMPAPNRYLLSGDGALLPGLADYISQNLGVAAELLDPWANIKVPNKFKEIIAKNKPSFAVSIGLALKAE